MRLRMILLLGIIMTLCVSSIWANTDERVWTFKSGEKLRAAQLSYNKESGDFILLINDEDARIFKFDDLSPIDQAWLVEWDQIEREMDVLIGSLGGRFEHYLAEGEFTTDIYVYYPTACETNNTRPMLILFNAGGNAARYLKLFVAAAEQHGIVTVACAEFYNTRDDEADAEMLKRFQELLPIIESTIPHDPARVFMGGNSGGAMRAYNYTAQIERPWAGVYANAGWLGGYDYYDWPYPSGMRISMVNGNNDHANRWLKRDGKLLSSRGNNVALFSFDGGHQPAPPSSRAKALEWLINENGHYD
jgi:surfactin synthase thioesterase subunit